MDPWLFLLGAFATLFMVLAIETGPKSVPILYFILIGIFLFLSIGLFYLAMATDINSVSDFLGI